jgi:hypothetical protein
MIQPNPNEALQTWRTADGETHRGTVLGSVLGVSGPPFSQHYDLIDRYGLPTSWLADALAARVGRMVKITVEIVPDAVTREWQHITSRQEG